MPRIKSEKKPARARAKKSPAKAVKRKVPVRNPRAPRPTEVKLLGPYAIGAHAPKKIAGKTYYIDTSVPRHQRVLLASASRKVEKGWINKTTTGRWRAHPTDKRPAQSFDTRRGAAFYILGAMPELDAKLAVKKPRAKKNPPTPSRSRTRTPKLPPPPAVAPKRFTKKALAPASAMFSTLRSQAAKKHPQLEAIGLRVDDSIHKKPRDFAYATLTKKGPEVAIAPELAKQSSVVQRGVLGHEIAHCLVLIGVIPMKKGYDAIERQADAVAEELFGQKMFYNKNGVQCMGRGARGVRPRPKGLR